MSRGTMEARLDAAERKINELTRRLASVNAADARSPLYHDDDQVPFKNVGAVGDVPAYGVMRITGTVSAGGKALTCARPDGTRQRCYLINGPVAVSNFGWGRMCSPTAYALYDEADGAPAVGEVWGPASASWKLRKAPASILQEGGFLVLGGDTGAAGAKRVLVKHVPNYDSTVYAELSPLGVKTIASAGSTTLDEWATITVPGKYLIFFTVTILTSATGTLTGELLANGSSLPDHVTVSVVAPVGYLTVAGFSVATLAAGDQIKLRMTNTTGADAFTAAVGGGAGPYGYIVAHSYLPRG